MEPLLPLKVDIRASEARLRQLHRQLRSAILDGRLSPGLRLPSTRGLARLCGVGRNAAVAAYDLLQSEGYIVCKSGSGSHVATTLPRRSTPTTARQRTEKSHRLAAPWRRIAQQRESGEGAPRFAFTIGVPDVTALPSAVWRRSFKRTLHTLSAPGSSRAEPQGRPEFRQTIAHYVSYARAVACNPDDIVVTAGAQQAFELLARILVTSARTLVAMEDPGYPDLRRSFASAGARIAAVPVDHNGLRTECLPKKPNIICVTPSHQFPLGCVMSASRRTQLLDFAHANGAIIIEDDYDGEFRFTERPLDALQTLDRSESVFYVGTFSKNLLPALRLGFIVTPPWAKAALVSAKSMADGECCTFTQEMVCNLIKEGELARHVRRMQQQYLERHRLLREILRRDFQSVLTPVPSAAGLHIAAVLTKSIDDRLLCEQALEAGVGLTPLSKFGVGRNAQRGIVFGYGALAKPDIIEGMARLRKAWGIGA